MRTGNRDECVIIDNFLSLFFFRLNGFVLFFFFFLIRATSKTLPNSSHMIIVRSNRKVLHGLWCSWDVRDEFGDKLLYISCYWAKFSFFPSFSLSSFFFLSSNNFFESFQIEDFESKRRRKREVIKHYSEKPSIRRKSR